MKKLGQYLLANNTRAAVVACVCTLLPLVALPGSFMAATLVGLVTLRKGYRSGLFVMAFVALPAICLLILREFTYGPFYASLILSVFVWVFALMLRNTRSWALVLETMALFGAVGVVAIHLWVPDIKQFWLAALTHFYQQSDWIGLFKSTPVRTESFVSHAASVATGCAAFILFLVILIQLLLARWWQAVVFNPGSLREEFTRLHVNRGASTILTIASLALCWKFVWLVDLYPILLLPYAIAGLSLLHRFTAQRKEMVLLLVAVYVAILIFSFMMVAILAIVGFVDSWVDFRKYQHPLLQSSNAR